MFFLFRVLNWLPLAVLHNLGALAGWLNWLLSPSYRRLLRENLAQAGLTDYRNEAVVAAGQMLFELPKIGVWDAKLEGLWENAPVQANDLTKVKWTE